jgi:ribosome maturation factor RimP
MNFFEKNIYEQIEQVVSSKGFFLVDLVMRGDRKNRVIEVYVDSEMNVTADDCAEISRGIHKQLEDENIVESGYRLDVSSPGVNRPLRFLKQYHKHIDRKFDISYQDSDSIRKFSGTLKDIEGNELLFIKSNKEEVKIDFDKIIKAKVLISFS